MSALPEVSARAPWVSGLMVVALAAGGLAITNPAPAEFQDFAAERLVDEISEELCGDGGLPVLMRMALTNCQELVQGQRSALGSAVAAHTRRRNLGLLSVYTSEIGGQSLLRWRVPRFRSTVVGVAGQFVLVRAASDSPQSEP